jgi:hypothetical protein
LRIRGSGFGVPGSCVVSLALAVAVGCSSREEPSATTDPVAAPAQAAAAGTVPHGDHNPHHGGIVLMKGDLHFEVVPDAGGHHRLYFTDAARADLPAAVAQTVSLTIHRPDGTDEIVSMHIDEAGESWEAAARPLDRPDATTLRIAFTLRHDQPYWIDVPVRPAAAPTKHP